MAAVLAGGSHALISHLCALVEWRLPGRTPNRPGIRFHRTESLLRRDVRRIERIPLTSPARTLLDVSALLPIAGLEGAVAEAFARTSHESPSSKTSSPSTPAARAHPPYVPSSVARNQP